MKIYTHPQAPEWNDLLKRPVLNLDDLDEAVRDILLKVQRKGDKALRQLTLKFDKIEIDNLAVSEAEIANAVEVVPQKLKTAIQVAKENIEKFHASQKISMKRVETTSGVVCWQKSVPIEKVGLYVPGGTAALFSSVLMLAIPAAIAGCKEIVLCTPPDKSGVISPAILYTAQLCGVTKIFKVGGAQAIGAMAYGTETVPKVYKIFGPGNQYVTAAKQIVASQGIAIDMPAGPSEVAVIADETANPAFVAADLLSQAEHGVDSQVILFTTSEKLIAGVQEELAKQLPALPRKEIAEKALAGSRIFLLSSSQEMVDMSNQYAPEHLIISTKQIEWFAERIINAGSVFLGNYTPESAGDYASGTNHTLPTNGFAKAYSGVNLDSFLKRISFQQISAHGIQKLGPSIELMAEAEQLFAHKNAVTIRMQSAKQSF